MLKKITLIAMATGALSAFLVPAMASAHQWTYNNLPIGNGVERQEEYEGFVQFTTPKMPLPEHSTFGCDVTVTVKAVGTASGTGTTEAIGLTPTTATCQGTGIFTNCTLATHKSNPPWPVQIEATDLTIIGPMTFTNTYGGGACLAISSTFTFETITGKTTNGGNGIEKIELSGTATNGVTTIVGTISQETGGRLGVDY